MEEPHRNPSPPESPTRSHDPSSWSHDSLPPGHATNSPSSLVNYDDRIGDTVFSKAWVLSMLVKAVQAVKDQQSKIEISSRQGNEHDVQRIGNVDEEKELMRNSSDEFGEREAKVVRMEASECDQSDLSTSEGERVVTESVVEGHCDLAKNTRGGVSLPKPTKDENERLLAGSKEKLVSSDRSDVCKSSGDTDQAVCEEEGERGERGSLDEGERVGDSLSLRLEEIDENLENDLCRLWDVSMNMVGIYMYMYKSVSMLT